MDLLTLFLRARVVYMDDSVMVCGARSDDDDVRIKLEGALVDKPPFRPAIGPGSFQNRDQCLHRPRNGPGLSEKGNGPGSCGTTVPVVATNRDQCSGDQHVAHCEALVPVCGNNRDRCLGYMSPPASTLLKKFQDCVWGGVGARIFSLIALELFDEMSKPHLDPQNSVSPP